MIALAEQAGDTSIAAAGTEQEGVDAAYVDTPDIILSDVTLAAGSGPGAVQTI